MNLGPEAKLKLTKFVISRFKNRLDTIRIKRVTIFTISRNSLVENNFGMQFSLVIGTFGNPLQRINF